MRWSLTNRHPSARQGFTIVEMLIVVPIALLVVAGLVSAMVAMVSDALVTNAISTATYDTQDTLSRIEQDARVSINFMSTMTPLASPQGKDGGTASFQSSAGDLIMTQQATTSSPYEATRNLIYFKNQPNICGTSNTTSNRILLSRTVYFLITNADSTKTLWRRTIVSPANMYSTADANTVCDTPWQRNSCPSGSGLGTTIGSTCQTYDEKMIDNVTAFTTTYYTSAGSTTTDPTLAKTINVKLTTSQQVAGKPITKTGVVQVTRTNDVPASPAPSTPAISIQNPLLTDYNNSVKVSFQWSAPFATYYTVSTQVNGGSWTTPQYTTNTSLTLGPTDIPYAQSTVSIKVMAYNDYGQTANAQYDTTTMLWTPVNFINGWSNYGSAYMTGQFTKTKAGIIKIQGLISAGTQNDNAFMLPEGFRPNYNMVFVAGSKGGIGASGDIARVNITTDGRVRTYTVDTWVSLNNIQFMADPLPAGYSWTNLTLANGWTNTPGRPPVSFVLDSVGRINLRGSTTKGTIADGTHIFDYSSSSYGSDKYMHIINRSQDNGAIGSTGFNEMAVGVGTAIVAKGITGVNDNSMSVLYWPVGQASGWTNVPFQNSWSNYNATSYTSLQCRIASDGLVSIRGLVKTPSSSNPPSGQIIATLPSNCKPPSKRLIFIVANQGAASRVDIDTNGNIISLNTTPSWVSLDGITYVGDGS